MIETNEERNDLISPEESINGYLVFMLGRIDLLQGRVIKSITLFHIAGIKSFFEPIDALL